MFEKWLAPYCTSHLGYSGYGCPNINRLSTTQEVTQPSALRNTAFTRVTSNSSKSGFNSVKNNEGGEMTRSPKSPKITMIRSGGVKLPNFHNQAEGVTTGLDVIKKAEEQGMGLC